MLPLGTLMRPMIGHMQNFVSCTGEVRHEVLHAIMLPMEPKQTEGLSKSWQACFACMSFASHPTSLAFPMLHMLCDKIVFRVFVTNPKYNS